MASDCKIQPTPALGQRYNQKQRSGRPNQKKPSLSSNTDDPYHLMAMGCDRGRQSREEPMGSQPKTCDVRLVGKNRNGKARYWCSIHRAAAKAVSDVIPDRCVGYGTEIGKELTCIELDFSAYPGGVAIWGAVSPIYNTTSMPEDIGVHVHARKSQDGTKIIDRNYDVVKIQYQRDLISTDMINITREAAVSYYLARFLNLKIKQLCCSHCGESHLDTGLNAVRPHRKHLCLRCGRFFQDCERAVSNPISILVTASGRKPSPQQLRQSSRILDINQKDYPGGIQIWASNPAVIWSANRPEDEGLHVHLYLTPDAAPVEDETFGKLVIDGLEVDAKMASYLMAQNSIAEIASKVAAVFCECCGEPHFDTADKAFSPHGHHECDYCGLAFSTRNLVRVVANPLVEVLRKLKQNAYR